MEEISFLVETIKRAVFIGLIGFFLVGMLMITSSFKQAVAAHERFWTFLGAARHPLRPSAITCASAIFLAIAGLVAHNPWISGASLLVLGWCLILFHVRSRPDIFSARKRRPKGTCQSR